MKTKMNFLFICSMNQWRSPTAENIYRNVSSINVKSAGVNSKARRRISLKDIEWADKIFVMENKHKRKMLEIFRDDLKYKEIFVLDIPDDYKFMDEELIEILRCSIDSFIENLDENQ